MNFTDNNKYLSFLQFKSACTLNLPQRKVLSFLVYSKGMPTSTAIAKACGLTRQTVAKCLQALSQFIDDDHLNIYAVDSVAVRINRPKSQKHRDRYVSFKMFVRKPRAELNATSISVLSYMVAHLPREDGKKSFGNSKRPAYIAKVLGCNAHTVTAAIEQLKEYDVWQEDETTININPDAEALNGLQDSNKVFSEKKLTMIGKGIAKRVKPVKCKPARRNITGPIYQGVRAAYTDRDLIDSVWLDEVEPTVKRKGIVSDFIYDDVRRKLGSDIKEVRRLARWCGEHAEAININQFFEATAN